MRGMCWNVLTARLTRIEELYGEDTHLVTRMGVAMVSGMQGGTDPHTSLATNHSVICTALLLVDVDAADGGQR